MSRKKYTWVLSLSCSTSLLQTRMSHTLPTLLWHKSLKDNICDFAHYTSFSLCCQREKCTMHYHSTFTTLRLYNSMKHYILDISHWKITSLITFTTPFYFTTIKPRDRITLTTLILCYVGRFLILRKFSGEESNSTLACKILSKNLL